jgi:hypothetical protein
MTSWASTEGLPNPLGVSWCEDERAYNFAIYSKHATAVRLLLFDDLQLAAPRVEVALAPLRQQVGTRVALPRSRGRPRDVPLLRLRDRRPRAREPVRDARVPSREAPPRSLRALHRVSAAFDRARRARRSLEPRQGRARRDRAVPAHVRRAAPQAPPRGGCGDLRAARPRLHPPSELRRRRRRAGDVSRRDREDPVPARARRHHRRADAGVPVRSAGSRHLGLHADELVRTASRLRDGGSDRGLSGDGRSAPRRRHRGRDRRGLQPHRRGRRRRPDLRLQGDRQQHLLPDARRRSTPTSRGAGTASTPTTATSAR